ncbi:MAG: hypothetical protein RIG68_09405 [Imperialibacter sp.]|uniref:hypothetical protein n=1 Tax=Imperialibacter sp. TaxID=2038411 RepID=UPI0032EED8E5
MEQINPSYRTLRVVIGVLGIALPLVLILGNRGDVESSISFFYYTKMSVVFTGILFAFGLILISYKGRTIEGEKVSENLLTHIGGGCALLVALVPTKFGGDISSLFYSHNDLFRGWIHNISAVLFIFIMGFVVLTKFSRAMYFQSFYKLFGLLVLIGLAFTISAFWYEASHDNTPLFKGAVFWGESFSLWMFGIAWLRRGVPKNR